MATPTQDLDPSRPHTVAVNFLLNVLAGQGKSVFTLRDSSKKRSGTAVTSTIANVIANKMSSITRLPQADRTTRDVFTTVDVAGYNYTWSRYRSDASQYP